MKILLPILFLVFASCAHNTQRTVAQNTNEQKSELQEGDKVLVTFEKDVEFAKGQKRIIHVNTEVGGLFLGKPYPAGVDGRRINSMLFGYDEKNAPEKMPTNIQLPVSGLVYTIIIELNEASENEERIIKKGRKIVFELARDLGLRVGDKERNLNNLVPPTTSAISRVILVGGMYGETLTTAADLTEAVNLGNLLKLERYIPMSHATNSAQASPQKKVTPQPSKPKPVEIY